MIDPNNIINYKRTNAELEELILFLIFVAGKGAKQSARKVQIFLDGNEHDPFVYIQTLINGNKHPNVQSLMDRLVTCRIGQYKLKHEALSVLSILYSGAKLRTITVEELQSIPGIGPKSARCFVSWTRPGVEYAMLDTHILKYLKDVLKVDGVPKSTPTGKKYLQLEQVFLNHARQVKKNPAELDLEIWKNYQRKY